MSADVDLAAFLSARGLPPAAHATARTVLIAAGLTREGKTRLSVEKEARAGAALDAALAVHCQSKDCVDAARASQRTPIAASAKEHCFHCGGSENARAARELIATGLKRLVVVGGTPATREELERLLGAHLELRLVDGTLHRPPDRARADLDWCERTLLWGATELHHKVSKQYADVAATKQKVVHVPRRGIAQLLAAAVESVRRVA
ncbi:MAG: hypothetical protein U0228_19190 [Myxococcaceae bacterium]